MFLVTSVTTLRERTSGTLERLLAMPMGKLDFLVGYALAFGLLAAVQSALAVALCVWVLNLTIVGSAWMLMVVAVVDAVLGTALGLFVSAFARTEFQAVQFMPALVIPQILLCGLFVPRDQMPPVLEAISNVLPLSYAVDAMQSVASSTDVAQVWGDVVLVAAFAAGLPGPRRPHPAPPDALTDASTGEQERAAVASPYVGSPCAAAGPRPQPPDPGHRHPAAGEQRDRQPLRAR